MMVYLYAYLSTLAVFLPCDMVWLGTMASRLYRPTLGNILLSDANLPAAGAFYGTYPVGLVLLRRRSGAEIRKPWSGHAERRAIRLLHLHDLRSHQSGDAEKNWTTHLSLVDIGWGTLLGAISATAAFWVTSKLTA